MMIHVIYFSGSVSDSSILQTTSLARDLNTKAYNLPPAIILPGTDKKIPHFFIDDELNGIKKFSIIGKNNVRWTQKFFSNIQQSKKFLKNIFYSLSRARMTIEDAFGILTSKFQVLHKPLFIKIKTSINIDKALTGLHNFLIGNEKSQPKEDRRYLNKDVINEIHKNGRFTHEEDEDELNDDDEIDSDSYADSDDDDDARCDMDNGEDKMRRNYAYDKKKSNTTFGKTIREKLANYFLKEVEILEK